MEGITGNAHALATWFTSARDISKVTDEFLREELVGDVYNFEWWGESGDTHIVLTARGRCLIETDKQYNGQNGEPHLIWFTYATHGQWGLLRFWFNRSSVRRLFEAFAAAPEKRLEFTTLFINEGISK